MALKKCRLIGTGVVIALGGLLLPGCPARHTAQTIRPAPEPLPLSGVTVILDPGHGGQDPGAVRHHCMEAALTYRTAAELDAVLRARGAHVLYTVASGTLDVSRTIDPDRLDAEPALSTPWDARLALTGRPILLRHRRSPQELWQRALVARQVWQRLSPADPAAADHVYFLSIHYDDLHDHRVHGGRICFDRRAGKAPRLALALARTLHAHDLQGAVGSFLGPSALSARRLGVLDPRFNPVPEKVLLEMATLSHPQDRAKAQDARWRWYAATLIADAITHCCHAGIGTSRP